MMGRKPGLSLKARGKRPLSSFNTLMLAELKKAPQTFLQHRLEKLIINKAPHAPAGFAHSLAAHILARSSEDHIWLDENGEKFDVDIEFLPSDLEMLESELKKFIEEDVAEIIPQIVKSSAATLGKSLKADWPAQRAHDEAVIGQFRASLEQRWGAAFDTLRMMYTIAIEIGDDVTKRRRRSRAKKNMVLNDTLTRLHARACQVMLEIIILMENGLADGAMARWRTLHELTIVATLLVEHGEDLAIRYRAHEAVEAKRAMDRYIIHHEQLGHEPMTNAEMSATDAAFQKCLAIYGDRFGSEYGWAAHHLDMKKPRLVDLEVAVGKAPMQSFYRLASYNVHAGSRGLTFRLGILHSEKAPIAIAGASNAGFIDPAQNSAYDLVAITSLLSHGTSRFDRMLEIQLLINLRDQLPNELRKAQRELDQAHRAQLRAGGEAASRRKARSPRRPYHLSETEASRG